MTTNARTLAALLALALAAGGLAACGSSDSKEAKPRVLRFLSVDRSYAAIGGFKQGAPRVGDSFLFTTALYRPGTKPTRPSGKPIGRGVSLCTVLTPGGPFGKELACSGPAYLPGGYLLVSDAFSSARHRKVVGAVIGGVGAYANARGTAEFTVLEQKGGRQTNEVVVRLAP